MVFQPGNPYSNGRPPGVPNRRSFELEQRLRNKGDIDPAEFLSSLVTNTAESNELRAAASNYLLPYLYSKRGAVPTPRYIDENLQLPFPDPKSIEQANGNISFLSARKAEGLISIDHADSLINDNQTIINNLIAEEELKFKICPPQQRDHKIIVQGGLGGLPGTNISPTQYGALSPPVINGHAVNEQLLEAPKDDPSPGELKAEGPHPLQEHHFKPWPEDAGKNSNGGDNTAT